jgi:hypothetical protein
MRGRKACGGRARRSHFGDGYSSLLDHHNIAVRHPLYYSTGSAV